MYIAFADAVSRAGKLVTTAEARCARTALLVVRVVPGRCAAQALDGAVFGARPPMVADVHERSAVAARLAVVPLPARRVAHDAFRCVPKWVMMVRADDVHIPVLSGVAAWIGVPVIGHAIAGTYLVLVPSVCRQLPGIRPAGMVADVIVQAALPLRRHHYSAPLADCSLVLGAGRSSTCDGAQANGKALSFALFYPNAHCKESTR